MRSRSLRLSITILLILGVAIAALGFKDIDIDIPGIPRIEREGKGPLGPVSYTHLPLPTNRAV